MLTAREKQIAILSARGFGNKEIAEQLVITETTVRNYITRILNKLGLNNCRQLSACVWEHGLVQMENHHKT